MTWCVILKIIPFISFTSMKPRMKASLVGSSSAPVRVHGDATLSAPVFQGQHWVHGMKVIGESVCTVVCYLASIGDAARGAHCTLLLNLLLLRPPLMDASGGRTKHHANIMYTKCFI